MQKVRVKTLNRNKSNKKYGAGKGYGGRRPRRGIGYSLFISYTSCESFPLRLARLIILNPKKDLTSSFLVQELLWLRLYHLFNRSLFMECVFSFWSVYFSIREYHFFLRFS